MVGSILSPANYTDDELEASISKLLSRVNYVRYTMNNNILADQMDKMIDTLIFEKEDRAARSNEKDESPVVYDSDPSETQAEKTPTRSKAKKSVKTFRSGPTIIKQKPKNID